VLVSFFYFFFFLETYISYPKRIFIVNLTNGHPLTSLSGRAILSSGGRGRGVPALNNMPNVAQQKHIHKYIRIRDDRVTLWKCADPHCKWFMYKKQEIAILGNASFCWNCGEEFVMGYANLEEDLPMCLVCRTPDASRLLDEIERLEKGELNVKEEAHTQVHKD
jgi:hypothetical protein